MTRFILLILFIPVGTAWAGFGSITTQTALPKVFTAKCVKYYKSVEASGDFEKTYENCTKESLQKQFMKTVRELESKGCKILEPDFHLRSTSHRTSSGSYSEKTDYLYFYFPYFCADDEVVENE